METTHKYLTLARNTLPYPYIPYPTQKYPTLPRNTLPYLAGYYKGFKHECEHDSCSPSPPPFCPFLPSPHSSPSSHWLMGSDIDVVRGFSQNCIQYSAIDISNVQKLQHLICFVFVFCYCFKQQVINRNAQIRFGCTPLKTGQL